MMILAVDVRCNGPAHRHELRARRGRKKPPTGNERAYDVRERDARLAPKQTGRFVERHVSIQAPRVENDSSVGIRGIAVTPSQSPRRYGRQAAVPQ